MGQQKVERSHSKEQQLIVAFVLLSCLLILIDVYKNLSDEIHITSELKTLSTERAKPQPAIQQTLSEEEMKLWTERLKKNSET